MGRTEEISTGLNLTTYTRLLGSTAIQQGQQVDPVRPPPTGGSTALLKKVRIPPKKVYIPKIREEEVHKMNINLERTTRLDIIQIGTMDVPTEKSGKGPIVLNNQVLTPTQKGSIVANDHEASGSKSRP
jgi:hypothetical protein